MRETSAEREEVIKSPLAPAMGYVAKPRDPVGGNEIVPYLFPVGALDRQTEKRYKCGNLYLSIYLSVALITSHVGF